MTADTSAQSGLFVRAVTAVAILGPIALVVLAATLPAGGRGDLIVNGHIFLAGVLAVAIALRAAYDFGYERARKLIASTQNPRHSLTA